MEYPLHQFGCDRCGTLTEVLDIDQSPMGWLFVMPDSKIANKYTHLCPECIKELKEKGICL